MGNFGGCPGHSKALTIFAAAVAVAFAAKEIIQSPIMSRSRMKRGIKLQPTNHHAAEETIQYDKQAQIGIWKMLSAGDAQHGTS